GRTPASRPACGARGGDRVSPPRARAPAAPEQLPGSGGRAQGVAPAAPAVAKRPNCVPPTRGAAPPAGDVVMPAGDVVTPARCALRRARGAASRTRGDARPRVAPSAKRRQPRRSRPVAHGAHDGHVLELDVVAP